MKDFSAPPEVQGVSQKLIENGYAAYLVGGCVRDLVLGEKPQDWDIATNAKPEDIQKTFEDTVYENEFGTVGIKTESEDPSLKIVEVTTFRVEGKYSDARHPDDVEFVDTIEEDLSRRDFTVNALAIDLGNEEKDIIDPFGGLKDLEAKEIRAVGDARKRFEEDALRLLRAVRFSVQLDFSIEESTAEALKDLAPLLERIAKERIRDEFQKLVMTPRAADGMFRLEEFGLLQFIMPELREGIGCKQNKHHKFEVFEHNVRALGYTAEKGYSFPVRLASLLHDIGKPRTKHGKGESATFHGHEVVGARMVPQMLERLRFSRELIDHVRHLIRYHMFYYNVGEVSAAGVRRFLARVGPENIDDIMRVREADRIGSDVPKAFPYKLRHLLFMIEKVKHDPIHPKMLAVRGEEVMHILDIPPGPKVGQILHILLEEVIDDPKRNTVSYLSDRVKELGKLSDEKLEQFAEEARKKRDEVEEGIEAAMKQKYFVK